MQSKLQKRPRGNLYDSHIEQEVLEEYFCGGLAGVQSYGVTGPKGRRDSGGEERRSKKSLQLLCSCKTIPK